MSMSTIAKIYRPAKNAMQSGRGKIRNWVLEYTPTSARFADPLMGWTGSSDTNQQITLKFDDKQGAIAYCEANGIEFRVSEPKERKLIMKTYANNFSFTRIRG